VELLLSCGASLEEAQKVTHPDRLNQIQSNLNKTEIKDAIERGQSQASSRACPWRYFEAFNKTYAREHTLSPTGSQCSFPSHVHPKNNLTSGCAKCQAGTGMDMRLQCTNGLFCYSHRDVTNNASICRIDEYTISRTGSNECYNETRTDLDCPICYSGITCFSHAFPGKTDVDELRKCVPDEASCAIHYARGHQGGENDDD